jgi:hypothetical protein
MGGQGVKTLFQQHLVSGHWANHVELDGFAYTLYISFLSNEEKSEQTFVYFQSLYEFTALTSTLCCRVANADVSRNADKMCKLTHNTSIVKLGHNLNTRAVRARLIYPKDIWRIFDSKSLVDFFHRQ